MAGTGIPGTEPQKVKQTLEEHYHEWPTVRCTHCGYTFGAFPDMIGRVCPFCASKDKQGRPVQFFGTWKLLTVEQAEQAAQMFESQKQPVL